MERLVLKLSPSLHTLKVIGQILVTCFVSHEMGGAPYCPGWNSPQVGGYQKETKASLSVNFLWTANLKQVGRYVGAGSDCESSLEIE